MKKRAREKLSFQLNIDLDLFYETFDFVKQMRFNCITKNVTFLDEFKNKHEAKISVAHRGQHCFWDHHPFNWEGIHCPLRKEYTPTLKIYKSNINDNTYAIQDTLHQEHGEYLSDDYFCSPECALAHILENSHDPRYIDSKDLLLGIVGRPVQPAGSPRLLKVYGGTFTIEEFRKSFCNKIFTLEAIVFKPAYFIYKESYHL